MKFLCLAHLDRALAPPPDLTAQYAELQTALQEAGAFVTTGRIAPPTDSKTVRVTEDGPQVLDRSPSGEGSVPTAFFVIECDDLEAALGWAARIPAATYGSVEVRPPR